MDFENLNAFKGDLINKKSDIPYGICIAKLVVDLMPESCQDKFIIKNEEDYDTNKVTRDVAISYLSTILPEIIPEEQFRKMVAKSKEETTEDLEKLMTLCQIEAFLDEGRATHIQMISEAETEKEASEVSTKSFTDVVGDVKTPNIISVISKTITQEMQKSNKQMENIERTEDNLLINTDPDLNPDGSLKGDEGSVDNPDSPDIEGGNTGDTNSGDPENNTTDTKKKEPSVPLDDDGITGLEGEDGELYNESLRVKYAESLKDNIFYTVKNVMSKYIYNFIKDKNNGEGLSDTEKVRLGLAVYGMCTFGYLLDKCDLMDTEDYIKAIETNIVYNGNEDLGSGAE